MKWFKLNIVPILVVAIILCQNPIWPLWEIGMKLSFVMIFLLFLQKYKRIYRIFNVNILLAFVFLIIFFICIPIFTGLYGSSLIYVLCFLLAFTISPQEYTKSFVLLSKIYATILLISFVPWFINTFITTVFPIYQVYDLSGMKGTLDDVLMNNYFFYVENASVLVKRFYSMFDEPGVVGTLSAFILFAHRYNFRKWYIVTIFFVSIFTFSLAYYMLTALGYAYFSIKHKHVIRFILPVVILSITFYVLNETNETFRVVIVDRLFNKGLDNSLESRTGYNTQLVFDSISWSKEFFIGMGKSKFDALFLRDGASYKLFIIERGFLALLALFYGYIIFVKQVGFNSKDGYMLLFLFALSFLQRPSAFTAWQMFLFCSCLTYLKVSEQANKIGESYN